MPRSELRWRSSQDKRARKHLAEIGTTIAALSDNDLLDFADIFAALPPTILAEIASAEMAKRGISL